MLQNLSREVRECYQRAEVCAHRAQTAFDEETRQDFRALEKSWLKLAHSYEFAEQICAFTEQEQEEAREVVGIASPALRRPAAAQFAAPATKPPVARCDSVINATLQQGVC